MEKEPKYITLKQAAKISGYAPDYVGQLIRKGKLLGKQIYYNVAWVTTEEAVREYLAKNKLLPQLDRTKTLIQARHLLRAFKVVIYASLIFSLGLSILLIHIFSVGLDKKLQAKLTKIHGIPPSAQAAD
jgi:hypothetical protein